MKFSRESAIQSNESFLGFIFVQVHPDWITVSVKMVGLTVGVVCVIVIERKISNGGQQLLAPIAVAGTGIGVTTAAAGGTAAAVAKAAGVGAAVGAVSGAAGGGTVGAAAAGAGVCGAAAAGVTSTGAGAAGLVSGIALGPVGWLLLGAAEEPTTSAYTFDCWKQVVRDTSPEPSSGRLLREIVMDPRVKQVIKGAAADNAPYPEIILENIWDEKFRIEYVLLPTNQLAAHAVLLSN